MYPNELVLQQKRKVRLAIGFAVAGAAVLALAAFLQEFPSPFWLWALFAVCFVFFEWNTVEVNDKLFGTLATPQREPGRQMLALVVAHDKESLFVNNGVELDQPVPTVPKSPTPDTGLRVAHPDILDGVAVRTEDAHGEGHRGMELDRHLAQIVSALEVAR